MSPLSELIESRNPPPGQSNTLVSSAETPLFQQEQLTNSTSSFPTYKLEMNIRLSALAIDVCGYEVQSMRISTLRFCLSCSSLPLEWIQYGYSMEMKLTLRVV